MDRAVKATVFDIQRFAVNDGPGVRTIVFFKGCPLHCLWCHNPESLSNEQELMYFATKCAGCRTCESVCKKGVHSFPGGIHKVDYGKCTKCGACLEICCYDALSILGKSYNIEEILDCVEIDRAYFKETGGVTLSGGEPMYQGEAAISLAKALCGRNINVCMETCGFAKTELYEEIAPYIDTFLFDYKATPSEEYRRLTGVGSGLILKNLGVLDALGKKIVLRCPMIPGYNDTDAHLKRIAELEKEYPMIDHVELLPYHSMGEMKREQLGKEKNMNGLGGATQEQKDRWMETLNAYGCNARFA